MYCPKCNEYSDTERCPFCYSTTVEYADWVDWVYEHEKERREEGLNECS
jgi:RNA polymerase subunit RPABC4/transcription elongation factor Spt4